MTTDSTTLTVADAARAAGVVPRTIRAWLTKGHLTRYRAADGYHVRISRAELDAFLAERRAQLGPTVTEAGL